MPESHDEIHRSLGRIEGKQDAILFRLNTMELSVNALSPRVDALEATHTRWKTIGKYGLPGLAIAALAYLPEPLRKLFFSLFMP